MKWGQKNETRLQLLTLAFFRFSDLSICSPQTDARGFVYKQKCNHQLTSLVNEALCLISLSAFNLLFPCTKKGNFSFRNNLCFNSRIFFGGFCLLTFSIFIWIEEIYGQVFYPDIRDPILVGIRLGKKGRIGRKGRKSYVLITHVGERQSSVEKGSLLYTTRCWTFFNSTFSVFTI